MSNAIKYTIKGSVTIKAYETKMQSIKIEIIDTGVGMGPDDVKNLFTAFHKVENFRQLNK